MMLIFRLINITFSAILATFAYYQHIHGRSVYVEVNIFFAVIFGLVSLLPRKENDVPPL